MLGGQVNEAVMGSTRPTPSASLPNDTESPESWLARAALLKAKHHNGNGAGMPLAVAVKLFPTPGASDHRDRGGPETASIQRRIATGQQVGLSMIVTGALSPAWVACLMGFPPGWTLTDGPLVAVKRSTKASPRARRRASP